MANTNPSTPEQSLEVLRRELGDNLYSCCVFGSFVRGTAIEGVSDLNLLIILNESTPTAHEELHRAFEQLTTVDPFVLARRGFERSFRAFGAKFASIQRHYRVLHGADPFKELTFEPEAQRFLCEQGIRNLRLRLVYAFITRRSPEQYSRFLIQSCTSFFVHASEALRLQKFNVPNDFSARIPLLSQTLKIPEGTLRDWLELKSNRHKPIGEEIADWHRRVFAAVDALVAWVESQWKPSGL